GLGALAPGGRVRYLEARESNGTDWRIGRPPGSAEPPPHYGFSELQVLRPRPARERGCSASGRGERMGLFYANLTVYRPARPALRAEVRRLKRQAFLSPTLRGHTIVFDKEMDEQDSKAIERLGKALTKALSCAALAAVLHDDDVL